MEELSDYTSPVVEFKALNITSNKFKLVDSCTATDPLPEKIDVVVQTHTKCSKESQTETYQTLSKTVDERKLANWLQKIYPNVEKELLKGCTPLLDSYSYETTSSNIKIQPYQKLSVATPANSQGIAIWLALHTNNAPVLVVTAAAPHDDWCEHFDQYFKVFVPKRVPNGNFVTYNEEKCIPIKSCLRSLCTNPFNKNIFVGSTFDGDIYVWQYEQYHNHSNRRNNIEINELYHTTSSYGFAVAIDWTSEFTFLTGHSNGYVLEWQLGKDIVQKAEHFIKSSPEISTLLALTLSTFVVGTKDGSVFHCTSSHLSATKDHLEIVSMKKHLFMTSTLLKTTVNGHKLIISCDLSGQVYFQDIRNSNDDTDTTVTQIPLPFTNTIACSPDGCTIYSPGNDGSLQCYNHSNGSQTTIKGALKGKGNFIKSSDNGCWLITGLYENEFQIFSLEN